MLKIFRIISVVIFVTLYTGAFSYATLCILPQDEKSSATIREIASYIEKDAFLSKVLKINRTGDGDFYFVYDSKSGEIKILNKALNFKVIAEFSENDYSNNVDIFIYDLLLNKIGIPVKNILLTDTIKFISPFIYADSYLIESKTQRLVSDFKINYNTGEIELTKELEFTDKNSIIYPVNSFGPEISGPFSPVVASKINVEYIPSLSKIYIKNNSERNFYAYLFSTNGLYQYFSENLLPNSSMVLQINWNTRKTYLAVSEEKINFSDFEHFKSRLKFFVESGKVVIYCFRFPENRVFKTLNPPSIELFDYDYSNQKVILRLKDNEFDKNTDSYLIIVDKKQELTFKIPDISFSYSVPVKELIIIKRRTDKEITFESPSFLRTVTNTPPGILLGKYEVRNGEFINFTLVDLDDDKVRILGFEADVSGIQYFNDKILFTNIPVGEHRMTFKLYDGKEEFLREVKVTVLNTSPTINNFDYLIDNDRIVIRYNVSDPDTQNLQNKITMKNENSNEYITKFSNQRKDDITFKMLPFSGIFKVTLTASDGIDYIAKETVIQYESPYKFSQKSENLLIFEPITSEKIIRVRKEKDFESEKVKVLYVVSKSKVSPSNFWELINNEETVEIDLTNIQETDIEALKSGYYHFGVISEQASGDFYFEKFDPIFINEPPKISIINSSLLGMQALINLLVSDPDNDDYSIDVSTKNLDTNETKSIKFQEKTNVIGLKFDKAGVYDVELSAIDLYGAQSNKERIRLQIPKDLPVFSVLSPNNISIKPTQSVQLSWELQSTAYNFPIIYEVYVGESVDRLQLYTSTSKTTLDIKVTPGKNYYWKVVARYSKSLYTESELCKFYVENENISYITSLSFSSNIVKVIQNQQSLSKLYVILANGKLLEITVGDKDYKILGNLYSTLGKFVVSGNYLLNYSSNTIFVYDLNNLSLVYWLNSKNSLLFANIYNDTLVYCTNSQIFLYNLSKKTSSNFATPQIFTNELEIYPYYNEKTQLLIFPDSSYILFIDLERQKLLRQEVVYSRGNVIFCDLIKDNVILTLDIYGQMNSYKLTENSLNFISLSEVGISYPSKVIKLGQSGIIFSKSGKISMYTVNESGTVKSTLKEFKENIVDLVAPIERNIIYITKNRLEYCQYDENFLFALVQIRELPIVPVEIFHTDKMVVVYDNTQIFFYEIRK